MKRYNYATRGRKKEEVSITEGATAKKRWRRGNRKHGRDRGVLRGPGC